MKVRPLRRYHHPDLSDYVVHLTGRTGGSSQSLPQNIASQEPWQRLGSILMEMRLQGFPPFGGDSPVVCFTECSFAGVQALIRDDRRYSPCGIGFSKDFISSRGGGPAYYIRGDQWGEVDQLPASLRPFATRLWPGAQADEGEELEWWLSRESQWTHEREWRVPVQPNGELSFTWDDVAFVIAPDPRWQGFIADFIGSFSDEIYAMHFMELPCLIMNERGELVQDPSGVWTK